MKMCLRRVSAGLLSASLVFAMGQGCPGTGGGGPVELPGSTTISSLELSDATVGGAGRIRVTMVDPVAVDTQIALTSTNTAVLTVPATLIVPAGSASGSADFAGVAVGSSTITASLGDSQRNGTGTVVNAILVDDIFASGLDLDSGGTAVQTGSTGFISISLNAATPVNTSVTLTSDNSAVVAVPASVIIPEFDSFYDISFIATAAGTANISAQLNGATVSTRIVVTDSLSIDSVNISSTVLAGTQSSVRISLNTAAAADTTITLSSSVPGVITLPASAVIVAGNSSITVPVDVLAAGQSVLSATLGTTPRSAAVTVVGALSITDFNTNAFSFEGQERVLSGQFVQLQIDLNAEPATDTQILLTSSEPAALNVPPNVVVPAGNDFFGLNLLAGTPGTTTLIATLGTQQVVLEVRVVADPSIDLLQINRTLVAGGSTLISVSLDVEPLADTLVALSSSNPAALTVPSTLLIPAGELTGTVTVPAGVSGTTLITASLGASQQTTIVTVVSQLALTSLIGSPTLETGGLSLVTASLNADAPTDTTVTVSAVPAGVISVPASFVIPAGSNSSEFLVQAIVPGATTLTCTVGGSTIQLSVSVVASASVNGLFGTISVGQIGTISVFLDAIVSADTVVNITNSDPTAFVTPSSVIVFAGSSSATFQVVGLAATPTTVTATLGASSANSIITPF